MSTAECVRSRSRALVIPYILDGSTYDVEYEGGDVEVTAEGGVRSSRQWPRAQLTNNNARAERRDGDPENDRYDSSERALLSSK